MLCEPVGRWAAVTVALFCLSCGGAQKIGQQCSSADACSSGVCLASACVSLCESQASCQAGQICVTTASGTPGCVETSQALLSDEVKKKLGQETPADADAPTSDAALAGDTTGPMPDTSCNDAITPCSGLEIDLSELVPLVSQADLCDATPYAISGAQIHGGAITLANACGGGCSGLAIQGTTKAVSWSGPGELTVDLSALNCTPRYVEVDQLQTQQGLRVALSTANGQLFYDQIGFTTTIKTTAVCGYRIATVRLVSCGATELTKLRIY